jgi:hypothetical protein
MDPKYLRKNGLIGYSLFSKRIEKVITIST